MEPECEEIMTESYNINYIDESEYPSTTSIQNRSARAGYKVIMCYPSTTSIQDRSASGSCLYQALRIPQHHQHPEQVRA